MDNLCKLFLALKRRIVRGDDYIIKDCENAVIEEASEALLMNEPESEFEKMDKKYWSKDVLEKTREIEMDGPLTSPVSVVMNAKDEPLSEVVVNRSNYETLPTGLNAEPSENFPPADIDAIVKMFHENDVDGLERKLEEVKEEGDERKQPKNPAAPEQKCDGEFIYEEPEYWCDDEFAREKPTHPTLESILRDFRKKLRKYDTSTPCSSKSAGRCGRFNTSTPYSVMSTGTHASSSNATQSLVHSLRKSVYKEQGLRPVNPQHLKIAFECSDEENEANEDHSAWNSRAAGTSSPNSGDSTRKKRHMRRTGKRKH